MKKLKAFISGKVTGLDFAEAEKNFAKLEKLLLDNGYTVVNPIVRIQQINAGRIANMMEPWDDKKDRRKILGVCLYDLSTCDEIHFLPNYKESKGSLMELDFAEKTGMTRCFHPFLEGEINNQK